MDTSLIETLQAVRDGKKIPEQQLKQFINDIASEKVSDAQAAAFTMAVSINDISDEDTAIMTKAMAHSGQTITWDEIKLKGPVIDKHSSGGVGDKVSLILAPIVAACGGFVPMASGRGLEHTGGTLDKLEAIPGYKVEPTNDLLKKTLQEAGCVIIGASKSLAPADRRLYAIRDVTATTESHALITASILSKKVAAGNKRMVMDIKAGTGAFMSDVDSAKVLGKRMQSVAKHIDLDLVTLISDMNTPIGSNAGNALEIEEVTDILTANIRGEQRLMALTYELAAEMLVLGKVVSTLDEGRTKAKKTIEDGTAAECFSKMVAGLGGPIDFLDRRSSYLKRAPHCIDVYPTNAGFVSAVDVKKLGFAIVDLGAGRRSATDVIDFTVGVQNMASVGDKVGDKDKPLAILHTSDKQSASKAISEIQSAYQVVDKVVDPLKVIYTKIT